MNVEVRSVAHLDIAKGVAFYDRQGFGAGDYFYQRIFEDIDSLSATAGIHEIHFSYHRNIGSRHSFLIYYQMVTMGVEVVAVLDDRSCPADIDALPQRC